MTIKRRYISEYRLIVRFAKGTLASAVASSAVLKASISWPWQVILISVLTGIIQVIEKFLKEISKNE